MPLPAVVYAACPALRELSDAPAAELFAAEVLTKVQHFQVHARLQKLEFVERFRADQVPQVLVSAAGF